MTPVIRSQPARLLLLMLAWVCAPCINASPAKFLPPEGRQLLIIGQDLESIRDYRRDCVRCATPAGVTVYLGFYRLLDPASNFGGLGQDAKGGNAPDADWGAGITSAARAARENPESTLVLGLDISNGDHPGGLAEIGQGKHDDKIRRLARFCAGLNRPVFLRIGYEFDGSWNQGYANTTDYKTAFRRIVEHTRREGAANVAFVWQASASPLDDIIEGGKRERVEEWYPGADVVDWMGLSWFLPPEARPTATEVRPPTQRELADELLALARREHKPVLIAESAPQGYDIARLTRANISPLWNGKAGDGLVRYDAAGLWREWFRPLFDYIAANRDVIRGLAYINAHWDAQRMWGKPYNAGYWGDSRIQKQAEIQLLWIDETHLPAWLHGGPELFKLLQDPKAP